MEMEAQEPFDFNPTKEEAVAVFLPSLLAGVKHKYILPADVYAREPKDLAVQFAPVPRAESTGDRFFFTTCKGKNGRFERAVGDGTWFVQKTKDVIENGVEVGKVRHLSFKKNKKSTGWVMEEYLCFLPEAVVSDGEKVLCKIHLAPGAPAAAREESDAYKLHQQRAETPVVPEPVSVGVTASAHAQKRPAPIAAAGQSSRKKMRMAAPVAFREPEQDCPEMKFHNFNPTKEEAVAVFLPSLLAGVKHKYILPADVYAREPKAHAAQLAPVPRAESTGDRFFFTTCKGKGKNRFERRVGAGTWSIQKTEDVHQKGVKVGEVKHLSFKINKKSTGWVMEEYRCLLPEAIVAGGEKVLCKLHLAEYPPVAAREESNAYKLREIQAEPPVPGPVTASAHAHKSPAPVAADPPCSKEMLMAAPVPEPEQEYPMWSTSAAPVYLPDAPEADGDMGRFSCTMEELLGVQEEEQADNNMEEADGDLVQEEPTLPVEADNSMERQIFDEEEAVGGLVQLQEPTLAVEDDWGSLDLRHLQGLLYADDYEQEADQLDKRCNYNADLVLGRNQLFGAVN